MPRSYPHHGGKLERGRKTLSFRKLSRPSPGSDPGPVQVPLSFTAFRTHSGPKAGPGSILVPRVPSRIGPGRAETSWPLLTLVGEGQFGRHFSETTPVPPGKNGQENHHNKKTWTFYPYRTRKILGKEGQDAPKIGGFLTGEKTRNSKIARKGRTRICMGEGTCESKIAARQWRADFCREALRCLARISGLTQVKCRVRRQVPSVKRRERLP